ncbi:MAG: acetyltransferase, partial [Ginsengibacter sp.]
AYGKELVDIYYFDDLLYQNGNEKNFRFLDFDNNKFLDYTFYIGIGYNHLPIRKEICEQILNNKFDLPSFIHKTSYINPTAKIANGVFIYPMCNIDQMVCIEDGVIINNSATISHDTIIDTCAFISPGVTIAGNVKIGKFCFVGTGSVVANNVTVGNKVRIGIGSNITKDVQENSNVIGNPFKILNKNFRI